MDAKNQTFITEFILLEITAVRQLQIVSFVFLLALYLFNLIGNVGIITLVIKDLHLHTPMYFFLGKLSFLDVFFSSTTVPKMLSSLLTGDNRISLCSCIVQLYFYHFVGCTEALLLTTMSYDRYLAICTPLHYNAIMTKRTYIFLATNCWVISFIYSLIHPLLASKLPFCRDNHIKHFFCDIKPLLKLSCDETKLNEKLVFIVTGLVAFTTFSLILVSYVLISARLLNIHSTQDRRKAFSTCTSHLIVFSLYYGSGFCTYLTPAEKESLPQDRLAAVLVTFIIPALNPLIYSLRNRDVKRSLQRMFSNSHVFRERTMETFK
ncbi:olfactory receptor 2AP1-like [Spea bombifrons]|uniref:olfactory receptor 2AP1-like n=1 Tax=Spea bombifrons TaxID=233779 RepID=UPI00234AE905|nr:olfactory receptor 2AP1-like [Spea bombifrons]